MTDPLDPDDINNHFWTVAERKEPYWLMPNFVVTNDGDSKAVVGLCNGSKKSDMVHFGVSSRNGCDLLMQRYEEVWLYSCRGAQSSGDYRTDMIPFWKRMMRERVSFINYAELVDKLKYAKIFDTEERWGVYFSLGMITFEPVMDKQKELVDVKAELIKAKDSQSNILTIMKPYWDEWDKLEAQIKASQQRIDELEDDGQRTLYRRLGLDIRR